MKFVSLEYSRNYILNNKKRTLLCVALAILWERSLIYPVERLVLGERSEAMRSLKATISVAAMIRTLER